MDSVLSLEPIRQTNSDPILGLKAVIIQAEGIGRESHVEPFLAFLREMAEQTGSFDREEGQHELEKVADSSVNWSRRHFTLYPIYVERLRVVDAKAFEPAGMPVPLSLKTPGEWLISSSVLVEGPDHYSHHAEAWRSLYCVQTRENRHLSGGLAFNVLEIPAEALGQGEVDLRPLVLHALAPDGSACDRGNPDAQGAIANAFWQTFWATGALRTERGSTFPVAFLPIDRSTPLEFVAPFHERTLEGGKRKIFGRSAILAYALEKLTAAKALLFDLKRQTFCVSREFVPAGHDLADADICLAIGEMNRSGFVDAYMGANRETFAAWRQSEAEGGPGLRQGFCAMAVPARLDAVRALANVAPERFARIHRVVPYLGCAFLNQAVNQTQELVNCGKVQNFDQEIVAATNSTFFLNFPEEYATLHSAMNDPVALLVENGRLLQVRTMRRVAFVLDETGRAQITTHADVKLDAEKLPLKGETHSVSSFERAKEGYGQNHVGPHRYGCVLVGDSVVEEFKDAKAELSANGLVVTSDTPAEGLKPRGAAKAYVLSADKSAPVAIRHAFAVGPQLVEGGKVVPLGESGEEFQSVVMAESPSFEENSELPRTGLAKALLQCEKRGVPPTRFPYDWDQTRAPRTALGIKPDGSVLLVVVDGRADLPHSVGVTLAELAQLMLGLGCTDAMNMDGGGSSVMFVNDARAHKLKMREELREGVVNLPSDRGGVERLLPVPFVISRRKKS